VRRQEREEGGVSGEQGEGERERGKRGEREREREGKREEGVPGGSQGAANKPSQPGSTAQRTSNE
jgi:hypothetical protein